MCFSLTSTAGMPAGRSYGLLNKMQVARAGQSLTRRPLTHMGHQPSLSQHKLAKRLVRTCVLIVIAAVLV